MKIVRTYTLVTMVLVSSILLYQCMSQKPDNVYVKDGKEYGVVRGTFRSRWWNYYERALSYAEGDFYRESLADLDKALGQRDKDQRMARTYGMHFIDYFPHRERGIVYYRVGNLEEARKELELSLQQYPSAKARFYLDKVRKALIEQAGKVVAPPRLALDVQKVEIWTKQDPFILSGSAEDENYVSAIRINRTPLFMEGARKRVAFKEPLPLGEGRHEIVVAAENLAGKRADRTIVVHVDRTGPIVSIEDTISLGPDRIKIRGSVYDEAGVSRLEIGGRSMSVAGEREVTFEERVPVKYKDLELVTYDRLGNRTSATVPVSPVSTGQAATMLACSDSRTGDLLMAGLLGKKDKNPPVIRIRDWAEKEKVFLDKVYLEGEIRDDSKIKGLWINKNPILRREGKSIFFSHLERLREGTNAILIEARDEAGNKALKKILFEREIPKALQLEERLSLTVLPFEQKGTISEASLSFQDSLVDSLVNQNRFNLVEREKLDDVLREQKLSQTALIDKGTALRLGKLVAAESIITGALVETKRGVEIVGRIIDTETSEILATEDVYDEIKDLPGLRTLAEGMAIKFHRDFPLLEGLVIKQKGKHVFTDLGQDQIKLHRRLIIYREEPIKHPKTGKVIGADNVILGRARVVQVMPEISKAEVEEGEVSSIRPLDKVITE